MFDSKCTIIDFSKSCLLTNIISKMSVPEVLKTIFSVE